MGKIDSGCKFLAEQRTTALRKLTDEVMFAVEADTGSKPVASVLIEFEGDLAAIEAVFERLIAQTAGHVFYSADDPHAARICAAHPHAISFGEAHAARHLVMHF